MRYRIYFVLTLGTSVHKDKLTKPYEIRESGSKQTNILNLHLLFVAK